jgi:molybdopterin/thiamine biosynthesis adenylyltransferase
MIQKSRTIERVYIPYSHVNRALNFLRSQGAKRLEGIVYWCGKVIEGDNAIVTSTIFPAQRASPLQASVEAHEVAKVFLELHEKRELLLAQIHSHPSTSFHSPLDDTFPVIHELGLLSVVVPEFGFVKTDKFLGECAFYKYIERGKWRELGSDEIRTRLVVLPKDFSEQLFSRTRLYIRHLGLPSEYGLLKFGSSRIVICIDEDIINYHKGQVMLLTAVNLLARCCVNLDVFVPEDCLFVDKLPLAEGPDLKDCISNLFLRINPYGAININPTTYSTYDVALIIGENKRVEAKAYVYIDSSGWLSYVGAVKSEEMTSNSPNPIGPQIAASYGCSEVIKWVLNIQMNAGLGAINSFTFSAADYSINSDSFENFSIPDKIDLGKVHLVGAGAIGMSVVSTLTSFPYVISDITVIDSETVEVSNLNRYPLATITDIGMPKVEVVRKRVRNSIINVLPFNKKFQQYGYENDLDLVIAAVDDAEARWDIQLAFPKILLNGGMFANGFTISRHDDFLNKPCLGCVFPKHSREIDQLKKYPALPFTSMLVGSLLAGEIIKEKIIQLHKYRLDRAFIATDLFLPPKMGETYLFAKFEKSSNCGCDCTNPSTIESYREKFQNKQRR